MGLMFKPALCTQYMTTHEQAMPVPTADIETLPKIGVREFRAKFAGYMRQAQAGQSFLVTSHDQVIAEIRPPSAPSLAPRPFGTLRDKIHMAPDFDTLPDDVLKAMEGDL